MHLLFAPGNRRNLPARFRIAHQAQVRHIVAQRFVDLVRPHVLHVQLRGGISRRELDRFLRAQGVEVNLVMHFDNIQMIKEAVALGQGISILPARTMQAEIEQGRLVAVRLNAPGLARPVGIVHRRRKKFNRATERLLAMLMASRA